ncbi:MAG TPA: AtpZ/AtpI family protein [Bacillota bacterium]
MNRKARDDDRRRFRGLSAAMAFGVNLVAGLLIGYYGGGWLDRHLDTEPWLTLVGITLGTIAAFRMLLRELRDRS